MAAVSQVRLWLAVKDCFCAGFSNNDLHRFHPRVLERNCIMRSDWHKLNEYSMYAPLHPMEA